VSQRQARVRVRNQQRFAPAHDYLIGEDRPGDQRFGAVGTEDGVHHGGVGVPDEPCPSFSEAERVHDRLDRWARPFAGARRHEAFGQFLVGWRIEVEQP
jgi:hypothetical protein